jgi:DNA-binding NarL/FixJ family response regulator
MSVVAALPRPIVRSASRANAPDPIRVLVVDDHAAVRLGVQRLLDDHPEFELTAVVSSGREAIAAFASDPVDVAVLDYQLGAGQDGLTLTSTLKALPAPPRVLIYSAYADAPLAMAAALAGADGLLSKAGLGDELCRAIRRVAGGQPVMPAIPEELILSLCSRMGLGARERALVRLVIEQTPDHDLAAALGMSEREIRERRRSIVYCLTGAAGRARLPFDDGRWPLDYTRALRLRG